jgi:hypothetical protein
LTVVSEFGVVVVFEDDPVDLVCPGDQVGAADFIGGVGSRRYSSWQVVLVGQSVGGLVNADGRPDAAG